MPPQPDFWPLPFCPRRGDADGVVMVAALGQVRPFLTGNFCGNLATEGEDGVGNLVLQEDNPIGVALVPARELQGFLANFPD